MLRRAALLTAIAVAACGELPQPFRHTAPNPLLNPLPLAGVTVTPVAGAPEPRELAEAMAAELVARQVVAVAGPPWRGGRTVEAMVTEDGDAVLVSWQLRGFDGGLIAQHPRRVSLAAWRTPEGRAATVKAAAPILVAAIHSGPAGPAVAGPMVSVPPVAGAPGDGAAALATAMAGALRRAGLSVGDGSGAFVIAGTVMVSPGPPGHDRLDITWAIRDADGTALGTVAQGNPVPRGQVDGMWGGLARIIAEAAADGVAEVVRSGAGQARR